MDTYDNYDIENKDDNFDNELNSNNFKDKNEDSTEDGINNDIFSKKKNIFRVEIRNKKTRTLLQQKRNKTHIDNNEILPPFYPEIIEQTLQYLNLTQLNPHQIEQNLKIICKECECNKGILITVKQSNLFMKLVQIITWGRSQSFCVSIYQTY